MPTQADDDSTNLMQQLDGVRRITTDKVDLHSQRPKAKARVKRQATEPEQPHSGFWQEGVSFDTEHASGAEFYQSGLPSKLRRRLRSGKIEIDDVIDLHGMRQHEAASALAQFLEQALVCGYRCLLVIHGQGFRSPSTAKLKPLTQRMLAAHTAVMAYCPAIAQQGGEGASYVYLRRAIPAPD